MEDYYYFDAQGQQRGPCSMQVIEVLREQGLLTKETLIQDGKDGVPFPLADLKPRVIPLAIAPVSPVEMPQAEVVDRWGGIARTYFTLAQLFCFISAVLILWRVFGLTLEMAGHSSKLDYWLVYMLKLGLSLLEFCFYGSLFFVFAYVKRRGLLAT